MIQKLTQKVCQQNDLEILPSAVFVKIYHENDQAMLLLVSQSYQVLIVNLTDYKITDLGNLVEQIEEKVRSYDKIVGFVHFNPKTGHLFVSFANSGLFVMFDIPTRKIVWNIPKVEKDRPLCAYSDQDKLIVAYDSNKILVYDLLNHKLHDWSRRNPPSNFPSNFLNRFNRIIGITSISLTKYILYTHYTYILLDLQQDVPTDEVDII